MKTKGWMLVLTSLIALGIFITNLFCMQTTDMHFAQNMTENLLSICVWGYGLYKGIKLLSMKRIPQCNGKPENETIKYSYSVSFWQYFKMSQLNRHDFSFITLFIVYYCVCLLFFNTMITPLTGSLLALLILAVYISVYVVKYRHFIQGPNNVEISPKGISLERNAHRSFYKWNEINWTRFFDTYGFLLSNGSAKLLVLNLQGAKDAILYYLNQNRKQEQARL